MYVYLFQENKMVCILKATYSIKSVVDNMLKILAHSDLPHQFILVSVHPSQLSNMGEHILKSIR